MNSHKPPTCLVSHTLGLWRDTSRGTRGHAKQATLATARVTKHTDSGLLVFLKGFGTSILSTCRTPLRQADHSNLKLLDLIFFF